MGLELINVYDFFSGCGGASQGFRDAGLNIMLGIDFDSDAAETFRTNFPEAHFIQRDIRNILEEDISEHIDKKNPMLFCGCAPCQPFSRQNRQKKKDDARINLLSEFLRFISYYMPDYIFIENVPGIQRVNLDEGPLSQFLEKLDDLAYDYKIKVVSASDFGVPQLRKRLILIATKYGEIEFPSETHGEGKLNPYSILADWINELPALEAGATCIEDPDHTATSLSDLNLKRIQNTPEGGNRKDWPEYLKLDCHRNHEGHTDVYGRLSNNQMASTLTTRCISYSNGRYGHPTQDRALSVREAACIQTFPREFKFCGSKNSRAKQIGNAVPPLVSYNFGLMFKRQYEQNQIEKA